MIRNTQTRGARIRSRLERLNARLGQIMQYATGGTDNQHDGSPMHHNTYTKAKKHLKSIPREIREGYEKTIRTETKNQLKDIERKRKALRATDIPSERVASKKAQKEERKQKRNA